MPRFGVIIETNSGKAVIKTSRRGVCDGCSKQASCSFDSALGKDVPEEVRANNPVNARVGDFVEFDLPGRTELKLSLLIWGLPLAGLIAGAFIGARLHNVLSVSSDPAALVGAFAGLTISMLALIVYDRLAARDQRLVPVIIRRITPASCPDTQED